MPNESAYQEFTGKSVEEALKFACEAFKVGLADLDFEILTPGSKGVLGMGAEAARIVAAPISAVAGGAPRLHGQPLQPDATTAAGQWAHVAITVGGANNTQEIFYINGTAAGTFTASQAISDTLRSNA